MWWPQDDEDYHMAVEVDDDIPSKEPRDTSDDFIDNVAYWAMQAEERGDEPYLPPELSEEKVVWLP
jgi:hypothetical protein